jgi:hypothetical protein
MQAHFLDTPNGSVVVIDVRLPLLQDEVAAARLRRHISLRLGEQPVLLRCRHGNSFTFNGDPNLRRYAVDPAIDALPVVDIDLDPPSHEAA